MEAIKVVNGVKWYNDNCVLDNIHLSLEKGSMYALLGSSGCGKTTLLSCILGLKKLDGGKVYLFGQSPKNVNSRQVVGYMPQDIALYKLFTIEETFEYFGALYALTKKEGKSNANQLKDFLGLPPGDKFVGNLSGGESRRVSLGVALLHKPKLLILDEPTVGVDPLLRERIWNYLENLVKNEGTTILLTTHYVEESRNCDMIGVLRNGRLILEDSPKNLLRKFQTNFLEDVVLAHCRADEKEVDVQVENNGKIHNLYNNAEYEKMSDRVEKLSETESVTDLCTPDRYLIGSDLKALVRRNLTFQCRDVILCMIQLIIPMVCILLGVTCLGKEPTDIPIAVVNYEDIKMSCQNESVIYGCELFERFSQIGLQTKIFETEKAALTSVMMGQSLAVIEIPEGFTEHVKNRFLLKNFADNETIAGSSISVTLDSSDYVKSVLMTDKIYKAVFSFFQDKVESFAIDSRLVELPLKFNAAFGKFDADWGEFMLPAVLVITLFVQTGGVGFHHHADLSSGTMERSQSCGVPLFRIILSYFISDIPSFLLQASTVIGTVYIFKGDSVHGSWGLIFLLCYLQRVAGTCYTFLICVLFPSMLGTMFFLVGVLLFSLMSSGLGSSLALVPYWHLWFCEILPMTSYVKAMREVVMKGKGLCDFSVLFYGFGVPFIQMFVCLTVVYLMLRVRGV